MKKGGLGYIFLLVILGVFLIFFANYVYACPAGQMPNFDGSCIGDPNYNAGAVPCSDLMATSGKSAETLCRENAAGQCCNQDNSQQDTSDQANANSDSYTFTPEDCSNEIISGSCELRNQFGELYDEIADLEAQKGYSQEVTDIDSSMWNDISNYQTTVFQPAEDQNSANFDACLERYKNDDFSVDCYDDLWKPQYDKEVIAQDNYELQRAQQAYDELTGLSSKTTSTKKTDDQTLTGKYVNKGIDENGAMTASIDGYLGNAYVERADGTKVIPGRELYLSVGDTAKTESGKLNILFPNGGNINLGENTELKVGSALLNQFYLAKGTLKSKIKWALPPPKFEIQTWNANFFIKGTEFVIDYNETTFTTTLYLNQGSIEVNTSRQKINLTAGNYLVIYKNGTVQINGLESQNWDSMGNNFYTTSSGNGFTYFVLIIIVIDVIVIIILTIWAGKKIRNPNKKDKSEGKGIASLVLGILGIVLLVAPYFGFLLSGIALLLGKIQKANNPTKIAKAGWILGLIGVILNMIILVIVLIGIMVS